MKYKTPESTELPDIGSQAGCPHISTDRYVHYTGSSMFPTFRDPEFLIYENITAADLRVGDVIIFRVTYLENLIVHRIISRHGDVFITRGDNNTVSDPPVRFEEITGRAVRVLGKRHDRIVRNGFRGRVWSRTVRFIKFIRETILRPLIRNPISTRISNVFRKRALIRPTLVYFRQPDGNDRLHMLWRGRLIGAYRTQTRILHIRRPYNMLLSVYSADQLVQKHLQNEAGKGK